MNCGAKIEGIKIILDRFLDRLDVAVRWGGA